MNAITSQTVQNAKLNFSNAFFVHDGWSLGHLCRNLRGGLDGPQIGRGKDHVEIESLPQESTRGHRLVHAQGTTTFARVGFEVHHAPILHNGHKGVVVLELRTGPVPVVPSISWTTTLLISRTPPGTASSCKRITPPLGPGIVTRRRGVGSGTRPVVCSETAHAACPACTRP